MKIAFLGTGLMGNPMAHRLIDAGYDVTVYNRTQSKTDNLVKSGAKWGETPTLAIEESDLIVIMFTDYPSIKKAIPLNGKSSFKGKTILQMSTIESKESIEFNKKIKNLGGEVIEAPVLGSIPQATAGELIVICSAENEETFNKWKSVISVFGQKVLFMGAPGNATVTKLALNQLIGSLTASFATSLGLLLNKGIEVEKFMDILRNSALYAPTFDKKLDKMLNRDFANPNFPLKHLLKDTNLILNELKAAGIDTSVQKAVQGIVKNGLNKGDGENDYSSLYNAVHPK